MNRLKHLLLSPPKIYVMAKMTGLTGEEMHRLAEPIVEILERYGFQVFHPVLKEKVPKTKSVLGAPASKLARLWPADKDAIKWADILLDTASEVGSVGVKREYGKGRYRDWKPMVSLWNGDVPFIAEDEDDYCSRSIDEAAFMIQKQWGNRFKRMAWRLPIYLRNPADISIRKIFQFFK